LRRASKGESLTSAPADSEDIRPDGTSIEDKGLVPDVVLDVPWYEHPVEEDPQVLAAEGIVQGK